VRKFGEMQLGEEGRERRIAQCWIFSSVLVYSYCLGIVLVIYIKEVLLCFLPHEVSQDKCCVSCDCVSLSDPTYAIVI
jgi:hypothetical protein